MKLAGSLFVLFANLVELLHVLEEVRASLKSDEELSLLAVPPVVRGLNCDGLGSDFLECGVVVPKQRCQKPKRCGLTSPYRQLPAPTTFNCEHSFMPFEQAGSEQV